ncbi:MAG: YncE family protein [Lentisphaerae bacterium]|nr:YncE family protein [Lentisphaerota bacterium]
MSTPTRAAILPVLLLAAAVRAAVWPGAQPDGSVLLPNQWSLRPVGTQVELGDFPVNIAVHRSGRFAAVLHAGYGPHQVHVVDLGAGTVVAQARVQEAFYGIEFTSDGRRLFCSGAGTEVVRAFDFDEKTGDLGRETAIPLRDVKERGVPAGLAVRSDATSLFVANVLGHRVAKVDLAARSNVLEFAFGAALTGGATRVYGAAGATADPDASAVTKRAEAMLDPTGPEAPFPYACRLDERRDRLYVSLWARASVAVIDLNASRVEAVWPTQEHPNEMILTRDGRLLYVANANRNTVSVLDTSTGRAVETIHAAMHPAAPPGSTPNSLALSPGEETLYVANANLNVVAVFDVSRRGRSRSLGFIPVGWYPTSVRVTPDGRRLLVANGKGVVARANPKGPQPGRPAPKGTVTEYIGGLMRGTMGIIDLPPRKTAEAVLREWTARAYRCSPPQPGSGAVAARPADSPVPARPGDPSPIRHCIYIVKENRTYDQVFGDMKEGNGDPSLCLFPERVTPNHHKLAREFVLLDNFYVESEVSADGHEWSMGAYATDFVEKTWPLAYGHNASKKFSYPSEGAFPIAAPAGGYLWDRAIAAGVSFRSYGEFVSNGKTPAEPCKARLKSLEGRFDPWFRSFDMGYSDLKRADRFIEELRRFEGEGEMPRLQVVRLPNDHTAGTGASERTPTAFVAENDLALGRVVEALSRSRFWKDTAIFVVEDDAQNGPDHVDAHRTVALVAGPHVRRGVVDSTMYSTCSMLRTMELILGMEPMTQFDAAAAPMFACFQAAPDPRPYEAVPANVDLDERNGALAWGAEESRRMDFTAEDAADDLRLNEVIWRSVKGAGSPMPAPVRAGFVFAQAGEDDDD